MKTWITLLMLLLSFGTMTGQSAKINTEKLLEYYENQRYEDAAKYLQSIYTDDTRDIKALSQIAYCNMMAGKLPEAEKGYLKINEIQPDNPSTLFSLVSINSRRGNASKAKSYLQQIIRLDSMNFNAYKQLAAYEDTSEAKLRFL